MTNRVAPIAIWRSRFAARRCVAAAVAAMTLAGCSPETGRDIRIGLLAVLHGEYASSSGEPSLQAARLAIRQINDSGGVIVDGRRHRLVLLERDHETRPDAAASAARASVNLDRADVLIGPQLSTQAQAAGAVAEEAGVPMISPMSSSPGTTTGRRFVFRLAFLDAFQGTLLADYAREELHARRAAMLYDIAHPYSAEIARLFRETFEQRGGRVVASETFTTDQRSDYRKQLSRIAAAGADVLLLPNYAGTVSVQARQGRVLGVRATLLGGDSWDLATMASIPEAEGSVVVHQWHPGIQTPQTRRFVDDYVRSYGAPPRATAALTYDAIQLVAEAIQRAGSLDGARIADAIAATSRFVGASGSLRFDGAHDPRRNGVLSVIHAGHHSLLRVVGGEP